MPKPGHPNEYAIHVTVVRMIDRFGSPGMIYYHPANQQSSGPTRGLHLKKMGVKPGVADLAFIYRGKSLFLELKTEGGKQTETQKAFQDQAIAAGAEYGIAHSIDEALTWLYAHNLVTKNLARVT